MIKKLSIYLLLFVSVFFLACGKEEKKEKSYDVAYINENLNTDNFESCEYVRKIESNGTLLLEEKQVASLKDAGYTVNTTLKKLAGLDSSEKYTTTTTTKIGVSYDNPIKLELKEEYFTSKNVSKTELTGAVDDLKAKDLVGIDNVKDLDVKVKLNDNLNVTFIELKYTDSVSGFSVILSVNYKY